MLALTWNGQELALDPSYPDPQPGPGEALVQVLLAGICGTDRAITGGYAQFQGVLGHEFVGRVLACMDRPELVGRRAAGEINIGCGRCVRCQAGMRNHCQQRTVIGIRSRDGVFANYVAIPAENLVPVPNGVPDEAAVFTEPLAAALEILEQVLVHPSDRVVVIGDGKLGQLVARVLHLTGCQLVVVGRHRERRSLALLRDVGIRTGLVDDLPDGWADLAVDCTGQPSGWADSLRLLRPLGTLVMKSTYHGEPNIDLSRLVVDEITLLGSRCGPFEPALRLMESGRIDPRPIVDAVYPLADGFEAFQHAQRAGALKVLLRP